MPNPPVRPTLRCETCGMWLHAVDTYMDGTRRQHKRPRAFLSGTRFDEDPACGPVVATE